jgi:ATP-binding protein involved in chromosome partitioning
MIDPRGSVVARRLSGVARVVGFCSAKGGVGKTTCTALAGVMLARQGMRVGILDLDLQGASTHILLGVVPRMPEEDKGILPLPVTDRLTLMSAAVFAGDRGLALRGPEVSDALLEMIAVTQWGSIDYLLIDMPPGIGEEVLDLARLIPRMKAAVISTPAAVSVAVVEKLLGVLKEMHVSVSGLIANEVHETSTSVKDLAARTGVSFAGEIPFDTGLEAAMGSPERLAGTVAARALEKSLALLRLT